MRILNSGVRLSKWLFLVSTLILTGSFSVLSAPLTGPVYNPSTGMDYYLLDQSTWTQAAAEAETLGGNLVIINDQNENAWVFSTFGNYGGQSRNLWIGLNSLSLSGDFYWMDGTTVSYSNWAPGEPNFSGEQYAYIMAPAISGEAYWNNYYDAVSAGYTGLGGIYPAYPLNGVVEVAPSVGSVPEPVTLVLLIPCLFGLVVVGRKVFGWRIVETSGCS